MPGSLVRRRSSFSRGEVGAVGDGNLAGVDGPADADAAAVVDGDPGGAGGGVEQGVEQRPVGNRVRPVGHGLGLPVRGGDGAGVEVVAADHDRRLDLAFLDELVEQQAGLGAFAVAEPADTGGQALELDALLRRRRSTCAGACSPGTVP